MRLDALLDLARDTLDARSTADLADQAMALATGVLDTFALAQGGPIQWTPRVVMFLGDPAIEIRGMLMSPGEARQMALALIAAADRAESAESDALADHEDAVKAATSPHPSGMEPDR